MNREKIKKALEELNHRIKKKFGSQVEIYLYGSVARGDYEIYSDIDVLIIFPGNVNTALEEQIFDEAFEVGLENDVVFGVVVYSKDFWNSEKAKVMPFYINVRKESIKL